MRWIKAVVLAAIMARISFAANVQLNWNANTESDLSGYKVYYGTAPRTYGAPTDVGNVITYTVSNLGVGTYYFAVTAYDESGNESVYSNEAGISINPPPPVETFTFGEPNVLATTDSGNGNKLIAQQAMLSQAGMLQSLSFYVVTANGQLRLGVYAANGPGGGPGSKLGETASFTPVAGWNTAPVLNQVSLPIGTYWLAYLPSSSSLSFKLGSGTARWYNYTFGTLPATFSTTPASGSYKWSFYGTLNIVVADTTPPGAPTGLTVQIVL